MNSFLSALKGEPHETIPVWYMRQAGRYLPGYTEIRKGKSMKEMCMDVETTVRITMEPVDTLGVDAAIIFSDIILPAETMGFSVDYVEGVGPSIKNSYVSDPSMRSINEFSPTEYGYSTYEAIRRIKASRPSLPVIGFSGGPLTVASYLAGGRPDRDLNLTKKLIFSGDTGFEKLMQMVTDMVIENALAQWKSGCDAIQIFDSWAGYLSPFQLSVYSERYLAQIMSELGKKIPVIYFSTQTGSMFKILSGAGFNFLSLDWRVDLADVGRSIGNEVGLQGNLDPSLLTDAPVMGVAEGVYIAMSMADRDNYIFNLGHGVLPDTRPETLIDLTEKVHAVVRRF
ncbi:MAG: uroporphyrinogen decarboxylase [Thermoplasmataceae archaeon]